MYELKHRNKTGLRDPFSTQRVRGHRIVAPVESVQPKRHFTIASLLVAVAGAAMAAYGAYQQAEKQKQAEEVAAQNAYNEAEAAKVAGQEALRRERRAARPHLESFRSGAGGMGVVGGVGSPLLAELEYAEQSELQAQSARYGYTLQADKAQYKGYLHAQEAAGISPMGAMGASLLQSTASIATSYGGSYVKTAAVPAVKPSSGGLTSGGLTGKSWYATPNAYGMG